MAMKFPAPNEAIITVKTDPKEARQCYMQSLRVNPYSLKTVGEQATQIEEMKAPLVECHNLKLAAKREVPEEVTTTTEETTEDMEDEVDLNPRAEFEEGRLTFDEPMTTVKHGPHPHQVTRLGSTTHRLVRSEVKRVLGSLRMESYKHA